jgi:hypothetical protein
MMRTVFILGLLGGTWVVYSLARWVLGHFEFSFVTSDSDRVALSFLAAVTYFMIFAAQLWSRRQR